MRFVSSPLINPQAARFAPAGGAAHRSQRRGVSLLEVIAAASLMSVTFATVLPVFSRVTDFRERIEERRVAVRAAANLMEEIAAHQQGAPLTSEWLQALALPAETQSHLVESRLDVALASDEELPALRRITLAIHWSNAEGDAVAPVELSAWFVSREEAEE